MLQVRFARPESEQARQRRIQSYEFLQKKQAEEPWVHLTYHGVKVEGVLTIKDEFVSFHERWRYEICAGYVSS